MDNGMSWLIYILFCESTSERIKHEGFFVPIIYTFTGDFQSMPCSGGPICRQQYVLIDL